MRTLVILAAGALLLAAAIVEIPSRLWPDSSLALLLVAFVALLAQGWLGSRLLSGSASPTTAPAPTRQRDRGARRSSAPSRDKAPKEQASAKPAAAAGGDRETGTVKWFNRSKGFGFIVRTSGEEIFVHQRSIRSDGESSDQRRPTLRDGQAVSFIVVEREKGLQAEDVTPEQ